MNTHLRYSLTILPALLLAAVPVAAQETDEQLPDDLVSDEAIESTQSTDGLEWKVGPAVSFSFGDSRNVVGQPDGWSLTLDGRLPASIGWRSGAHELRGALEAEIAFSRTPVLPEMVKSADLFRLQADYLYHALEWLGPYARCSLETTMIEGYDTRTAETVWVLQLLDGTERSETGTRLLLTEPFQPLTIRESVGAFAHPYTSDPFAIEARIGFGGLHTLADGQFTLADDEDTDPVEVKELYSFDQAAVEFGLAMFGELADSMVAWRLFADVAVPVVSRPEDPDGRSLGELTNVELGATLAFKLLPWLSLDYRFKALRRPQLVGEFQIQNNLLVTFTYEASSSPDGDEE